MGGNFDISIDRFASYLTPVLIAELAATHCTTIQPVILDAACGTGLVGRALAAKGMTTLHGTDISEAMLAQAAEKGCYRELKRANLYQPLPFPAGFFDLCVCAGAFCPGLLKARALPNLLAAVKPDGILVCDVERSTWGSAGRLGAAFVTLVEEGLISQLTVNESHFYAPAPGEACHGFLVVARKPPVRPLP